MEFLCLGPLPAASTAAALHHRHLLSNNRRYPNLNSPPARFPFPIYALEAGLRISFFASASRAPDAAGLIPEPLPSPTPPSCSEAPRHLPLLLFHLVFLFATFRARAFALCPSAPFLPTTATTAPETPSPECSSSAADAAEEDEKFKAALDQWKSKTFALTVPLRIVALRGSVPPSWIKDFVQAQGRRLKMNAELRASLESIYSEMKLAFDKGSLEPKSAMSADLISLGDSWLSSAIQKGLVEPIPHIEEQDWFKSLGNKWKVNLCRNAKGELDPCGNIWGVPYRWGTVVIAYKKSKFRKHNLAPIEDWDDLWRPELAGKISMIDSPREVVGAVLKRMGASYNTKDIDLQVIGGREGALNNLTSLQRQVRFFDSVHYLKSFGAGDVWVSVGWSSDVIPAAKRMSDVVVVVPKSGTSIWADLWAVPAATKLNTDRIGGRVRGPSPLVHQWIDFCLQTARALPFQQEVIPGASPFSLEHLPSSVRPTLEPSKGKKPKLDTNLVDGVPPSEILEKFMKPKEKNIVHTAERRVNSECKNASNPYHICAEYCFEDVPERGQPVQGMKLKSPKGRKKLVPSTDITGVNPHCRFASNPYHKCAEYCFQNEPEWDISDVTKSKEKKKAARDAERRDRKLNDYRFQGIPVLIKEKKEGPPRKDRKGDNPIMENKSMDFELVGASDTSSTSDSYKTITTHTGIDVSESVLVKEDKEVEANVIELSDTQPLRIDAFDLFHEWAKYCSLKATEDNVAKQDKTGQRG